MIVIIIGGALILVLVCAPQNGQALSKMHITEFIKSYGKF